LLLAVFPPSAAQQPPPTPRIGASDLIQTLDGLNVLGSLLIAAAHPDDENNAVLAYFARGRHIRTAYLSFTRGEGGQNLIGPEHSEALGLIRTQELLAARRVDGGLQFFTRAFDFGYSKNPEETLQKWGRDRTLADFVRVIRRFRPDVIVTRFSPTGSGGHGQHTASGHLAPAAFAAAADPAQFPDQIREGFQAWRARRLLWNTYSFNRRQQEDESRAANRLSIDAGLYDPVLGKSYGEMAGEARSQHASQGTGGPQRKGADRQFFAYVAGDPVSDPATADLFQGIDTTWERVPGAARLGRLLSEARKQLRPEQPEGIVPLLLDAYAEMDRLHDPWVEVKRPELLHAIELAAGLWLDAQAQSWAAVPGSSLDVTLTALDRSHVPFTWERTELRGLAQESVAAGHPLAYNIAQQAKASVAIPAQEPASQPYWMRELRSGDYYPVADPKLIGTPENPPALEATFYLRRDQGLTLTFRVPVHYRWVEQVGGEQVRPLEIIPSMAVAFAKPAVIFPEGRSRQVLVRVTASAGAAKGTVSLDLPAGWKGTPASAPFDLASRDQELSVPFEVAPPPGTGPADPAGGYAVARAELAGGATVASGLVTIRYPHIPYQAYFPPARARVESFNVRLTARAIGYVMGAGDEVPEALEQLGASVHLLTAEDLSSADLSRYDAIITGIRALNVRDDLVAARERLLAYVAAGGTLVAQYNRESGSGSPQRAGLLAPYPVTPTLNPGQHRVSVEEAPVSFPNPDLPILHQPNEITARDFDGWVQERGLYFMTKWDERYKPVFACSDPGEPPIWAARSTLVTARAFTSTPASPGSGSFRPASPAPTASSPTW
jgi:LmbE family N-acetylglucosaminyl deacetylase